MGRWAQRQLAGGGQGQANYIEIAHQSGGNEVVLVWRNAVLLSDLQQPLMNFFSQPSDNNAQPYGQLTARVVVIQYTADISADTELRFHNEGEYPGFVGEQTISYGPL